MEKIVSTEEERIDSEGVSVDLINKVKDNFVLPKQKRLDRIQELKNTVDTSYFEMAGILKDMKSNKSYLQHGISSWEEFLEEKVGYNKGKVQHLIAIYEYFAEKIGDEEMIRKITPLGWSVAKELVGVVNPSNVDEWVKQCEDKTVAEISKMAKARKKKVKEQTKTLKFKMCEEQEQILEEALALVKKTSGSDVKSNNLSLMVLGFLSSHSGYNFKDPIKKREYLFASLQKLEHDLDIKIIGLDSRNQVIFGSEYVSL